MIAPQQFGRRAIDHAFMRDAAAVSSDDEVVSISSCYPPELNPSHISLYKTYIQIRAYLHAPLEVSYWLKISFHMYDLSASMRNYTCDFFPIYSYAKRHEIIIYTLA